METTLIELKEILLNLKEEINDIKQEIRKIKIELSVIQVSRKKNKKLEKGFMRIQTNRPLIPTLSHPRILIDYF